jgi:hypothetical protein
MVAMAAAALVCATFAGEPDGTAAFRGVLSWFAAAGGWRGHIAAGVSCPAPRQAGAGAMAVGGDRDRAPLQRLHRPRVLRVLRLDRAASGFDTTPRRASGHCTSRWGAS